MDAPSRISESHGASLLINTDMFAQQHPEGVHPALGAPVCVSIICGITILTRFMTVIVSAAVSLNLH